MECYSESAWPWMVITNVIGDPVYGPVRRELVETLRGLVAESVGL